MKKTNELKHVVIKIELDDFSENPRDWSDCLSTFYAPNNNRYITGGKNDETFYNDEICYDGIDFDNLEDWIKYIEKMGGIVIEFDTPNVFGCYAVVEREKILKSFEVKKVSKKTKKLAKNVINGEIKEFNHWCNGEVYYYTIEDLNTGENLDSCGGFYGYEFCEESAQESAEFLDNKIDLLKSSALAFHNAGVN